MLHTESISDIINSISYGSAVAVSDGLFHSRFGTACWIIEYSTGSERNIGLIDVTGFSDKYNKYRSKLAGLYGIIKIVKILKDITNIDKGDIEV